MKRPDALKREDGFTLIEIIAVLLLIGILAAVAIPRYLDLQEEAELRAVMTVKAELQSRANQYFADNLLNGTAASTDFAQDEAGWAAEAIGTDYTLDDDDAGFIGVTVGASTNRYTIAFTQGAAATTTTDASPAQFGAVALVE